MPCSAGPTHGRPTPRKPPPRPQRRWPMDHADHLRRPTPTIRCDVPPETTIHVERSSSSFRPRSAGFRRHINHRRMPCRCRSTSRRACPAYPHRLRDSRPVFRGQPEAGPTPAHPSDYNRTNRIRGSGRAATSMPTRRPHVSSRSRARGERCIPGGGPVRGGAGLGARPTEKQLTACGISRTDPPCAPRKGNNIPHRTGAGAHPNGRPIPTAGERTEIEPEANPPRWRRR